MVFHIKKYKNFLDVRCACRHCRFNKCLAVGMDARAIQNDRDRIGPTKKFKMEKRNSSGDEDQLSINSASPQRNGDDNKVIEHLAAVEQMCNQLRSCILNDAKNVKETLAQPCMLNHINQLDQDVSMV